jgi:hypothetical protein
MADSIELSDGTVIEGKIVNADSRLVTIDVQFSPTIREEKSYPRAEVVTINRSTPDDVAFEEISSISPPSTADDVTAYCPLIGKVRSFIEDHSYSKHMPEVRKLAATLESERNRIAGGEVKVDGQWISGAAAGPDKSELGGSIQLSKMKETSDPASSLMAFEVLEKNYTTSSAYPEAVKLARESITKLRTELLRAKADLDRRTREQEQGLQLASADRRVLMEQGIAQEKAAVQAQVDRAKQTGAKWVPILPDAKVLDELSKLADTEDLRLSKVDIDNMNAGVEAAAKAKSQIETGQLAEAKTDLEQAGKLWPHYALLASLNESLKKAEKEAADKAKEETKP